MQYIDKDILTYFQKKIKSWGKDNYLEFPWRSVSNKWHALSAEIMLQRTKADQVAGVFKDFVKNYKEPSDYLRDTASNIFKNLGLPIRNAQFRELCSILQGLDIPHTEDELKQLPGVGEYISAAFLSLHLNKRAVIIDSNVVRVYGRFFDFETGPETRRKKWFKEFADEITPKRTFRRYNYGLIDFSLEICKVRPIHDLCPVRRKCGYFVGSKWVEN